MKRVLSILLVVVMAASAFGLKVPEVKVAKGLGKTNTTVLVTAQAIKAINHQTRIINAQQKHNPNLKGKMDRVKGKPINAKAFKKGLSSNNLKGNSPQSPAHKLEIKKMKMMLLNKDKNSESINNVNDAERESLEKDSATLSQTAVKLIVDGDYAPDPIVQEFIFEKYLRELIDDGKYEEALTTFSKEPFSSFAANDAIISLMLCDASLGTNDVEKFNYYLQSARRSDEEMAKEYYELFWRWNYETALEHPEDSDLAEWLLEEYERPAEMAYLLGNDMLDKYFIKDITLANWKWCDMSDYTPEQLEIIKRVIEIGMHGLEIDNERTDAEVRMDLILMIAMVMTVDATEIENATRYINNVGKMIEEAELAECDDLRMRQLIAQAYIAGHGIDRPKEVYKILNKNIKKVASMELEPENEKMYWDYLRAAGEALGKTKDAKRCAEKADQLQQKIDMAKEAQAEPGIEELVY